jgi:DNA-directed RNA polymerase subunit RPC12/RpoP
MTDILNTLGALVAALGNTQSAAVLREQLALLTLRLADSDAKRAGLEEQCASLAAQVRRLELQIQELHARYAPQANPRGHACDACGSRALRRSGSRPDPMFKALGIKQALYTCADCGAVSGFTNDE